MPMEGRMRAVPSSMVQDMHALQGLERHQAVSISNEDQILPTSSLQNLKACWCTGESWGTHFSSSYSFKISDHP